MSDSLNNNPSIKESKNVEILNSEKKTQKQAQFDPKTDIEDFEKQIKISMELPGVPRDGIHIEYVGSLLVISGEKKQSELEKDGTFLAKERSFGKFSKAIDMPKETTEKDIQASIMDGILKITISKYFKCPITLQIQRNVPNTFTAT